MSKYKTLEALNEIGDLINDRVGDLKQRHAMRTEFHVWIMSDEAFDKLRSLLSEAIDAVSEIKEVG